MKADVYPKDCPEHFIVIDGSIGVRSLLHETSRYYAHGVDETKAVTPVVKSGSLIRWSIEDAPINQRPALGAGLWLD
jgi:hypothetical protein